MAVEPIILDRSVYPELLIAYYFILFILRSEP
jgi:hypothetical protein